MDPVTINVGGTVFQTQRSTLQRVQNTRLCNNMLLAANFVQDKQHYFFDRDPLVFSYILNFYRTGELHLPSGVCSLSIKKELEFWMVSEDHVSECCWKELYQMKKENKAHRELIELFHNEISDCIQTTKEMSRFKRNMLNIWRFLEYPSSSFAARIWEVFYFTLIVISAFVFLLDSVQMLREPDTSMNVRCDISMGDNSTLRFQEHFHPSDLEMEYVLTKPIYVLEILDLILTLIFATEFLARFILCPRKCKFLKSVLNISDLVFLSCKIPCAYMESGVCLTAENIIWIYITLKTLTAVRLVRLFRIGRSCQGFKVMLLALKVSSSELFLMIGSFLCVTVLFAAVAYMAEMSNGTFTNMFYACWWAMITMTTVGYGDIFPITTFGRILGAMCAVTGLVVLTLPVAIIGTNYSEYYSVNRNTAMYVEERKKKCPIRRKAIKGLTKMNQIEQMKVTKF